MDGDDVSERVAIVGTRDRRAAKFWQLVQDEIEALDADAVIVTGCCPTGIGFVVRATALDLARRLVVFHARWGVGPDAGRERNSLIVDYVDRVIAIPCKHSRGTWDVVNKARAAGKPVRVVEAPFT